MGPPRTQLPVSRINTIMKSSSDVEMVSKESSLLMGKATELFIKNLATEAYKTTHNGRKLDYKNLAEIVHSEDKYEFLREIMPKKITVLEFKKIMARKQGNSNEVDKKGASTSSDSSSSSSDEGEDSSSEDSEESNASA